MLGCRCSCCSFQHSSLILQPARTPRYHDCYRIVHRRHREPSPLECWFASAYSSPCWLGQISGQEQCQRNLVERFLALWFLSWRSDVDNRSERVCLEFPGFLLVAYLVVCHWRRHQASSFLLEY
ncbi:hypothetical protein V6N12_050393 [Hibiscus sabdariffa]|uniref:Uncharacterized protein n=1 Tax=Hibiscus sabdariffa TaxID=183260 RepID=A0ABR2GCU5_9ROSI